VGLPVVLRIGMIDICSPCTVTDFVVRSLPSPVSLLLCCSFSLTGETKIGISYAKLCQSVTPGKRILIADGTLAIEVVEILNDKELRGRWGTWVLHSCPPSPEVSPLLITRR
jgi:hypothetical protein